jgi:hypothetical protein
MSVIRAMKASTRAADAEPEGIVQRRFGGADEARILARYAPDGPDGAYGRF